MMSEAITSIDESQLCRTDRTITGEQAVAILQERLIASFPMNGRCA
jgi:hypothetical protein